jgi:hypothetical protein
VHANVAGANSAEKGVSERVQENVAIAVTGEAFVVPEFDSADLERNTGFELVGVEPVANAHASIDPNHGFTQLLVRFHLC